MNGRDNIPTIPETEETQFIRKALAQVEKAHRVQRIKQIIITALAFLAAFWLASRKPGPDLNVECVVLTGVGLIAAVCTAKILSLVNNNTKAILNAIAELRQR